MSQNGQTHFNNLAPFCSKIFEVCLTILGHYALKNQKLTYLQKYTFYQYLHIYICCHVLIRNMRS